MHHKEGLVTANFGESGGSCEDMSYLPKGWGLVILMDDCLVQVLGFKAYPQLAICLFGVCQAADPWCGFSLFGSPLVFWSLQHKKNGLEMTFLSNAEVSV